MLSVSIFPPAVQSFKKENLCVVSVSYQLLSFSAGAAEVSAWLPQVLKGGGAPAGSADLQGEV